MSCPMCKLVDTVQVFPYYCICGEVYQGHETSRHINTFPGPGTHLHNIIPWLFRSNSCGCKAFANKMDAWGVAGCKQNNDRIIRYLVFKAKKHWLTKLIPKKVTKHQAQQWLDEAIQLATIDNGEWYVAVTTSPRKNPTVATCIDSIRHAGWEPIIFAEPDSPTTSCLTYTNQQQLGVWHNWLNSCRVALQSDAQYILTVQDDSLFHPDSRSFIEQLDWPSNAGAISLYTSSKYAKGNGLLKVNTNSFWGACALAWKKETLEQVINHPLAESWLGMPTKTKAIRKQMYEKRRQNPHLIMNSDAIIGKILRRMKLYIYCISPSPVSHIAQYSTISHGGNSKERNCNPCADHSLPLKDQV